jgi:hypothetical protein
MSGRFYVNLPANFVPIEGGKILRVFDYFNLPDELVELIVGLPSLQRKLLDLARMEQR